MSLSMRIAVFLATNLKSNRDVLRGIQNYCRAGRPASPWSFLIAWPQMTPLKIVARWRPDAIIAKLYTPQMIAALRRFRVPIVNTTNIAGDGSIPRAAVDEEAVGKMAAEHFLERGFRNFACVGYRQQRSASARMKWFSETLRRSRHGCHAYSGIDLFALRPGGTWGFRDKKLIAWLKALPKPVGIFLYHDVLAWEILEVCRSIDLRVPEDVALLGADDDELFCGLSQPPLSSIAYPAERIGFAAAELLDGLLQGRAAPKKPVLIPPVSVVTRQSTDIVAIEDRELAAAVRFIRLNGSGPIGVKSILSHVQISRRTLEQKFRETLGRSPLDEIIRVRIEQARQLLSHTDLPMPEVAVRSGFSNAERLSVVFKDKTGVSPTHYRRTHS
jgi:LacI family transcriptional regulator